MVRGKNLTREWELEVAPGNIKVVSIGRQGELQVKGEGQRFPGQSHVHL